LARNGWEQHHAAHTNVEQARKKHMRRRELNSNTYLVALEKNHHQEDEDEEN